MATDKLTIILNTARKRKQMACVLREEINRRMNNLIHFRTLLFITHEDPAKVYLHLGRYRKSTNGLLQVSLAGSSRSDHGHELERLSCKLKGAIAQARGISTNRQHGGKGSPGHQELEECPFPRQCCSESHSFDSESKA